MEDDTKCIECQCCNCSKSHNNECGNCRTCDINSELHQIWDYSCEKYVHE